VWLIGGTVVLAAVVLVWAFAGEIPGVATTSKASSAERPRPTRQVASRAANDAEAPEAPVAIGDRPPAVPEYSALLSRDVFQPLVVPKRPAPTKTGGVANLAAPVSKNDGPDTWHGWRFNGLAELSGTTYALLEQPENRRSSFLKEGDHLEDAKVIVVGTAEIVLQEPAGGIAHVRRVDAMAELMRAMRHPAARTPAAAGATAAGAGAVPVLPGGNPAAAPLGGAPTAVPAPSAVPDGFDSRRQQRRRQQFQAIPGEGSGTNANPNSAP
jgi:hypothetical protein